MAHTSSTLALVLSLALGVAACDNNKDGPAVTPSAAATSEKPGWLVDTDREIIRLQLEISASEKDLAARAHGVAGVLAQLEKGRLPNSWTETAFIVSKASAPIARQTMWRTLIEKSDLAPIVGAACEHGQQGFDNMDALDKALGGKKPIDFGPRIFESCRVKEMGMLDEVGEAQYVPLAFAAVAYSHLKTKNVLSPEEGHALRAFITYFSEYYQSKVVAGRRPSPPASGAPSAATAAPSSSAAPTPSASGSP